MGGIAEQRRRAQLQLSTGSRWTMTKRRKLFGMRSTRSGILAAAGEMRQHHVRRELLGLAQLVLAGQHRAAEVERAPVADRVIDHVPARPAPERRVGMLQVLRHLGGGDGGAEDDGAGRQRIAVADDALSHVGIDAVGADQRGRGDALAAIQRHRRRRSRPARSRSRGCRCAARSGHGAAGIEQRPVDVRAMRDRVRIAEAPLERARRRECWRPPRR